MFLPEQQIVSLPYAPTFSYNVSNYQTYTFPVGYKNEYYGAHITVTWQGSHFENIYVASYSCKPTPGGYITSQYNSVTAKYDEIKESEFVQHPYFKRQGTVEIECSGTPLGVFFDELIVEYPWEIDIDSFYGDNTKRYCLQPYEDGLDQSYCIKHKKKWEKD